MSKRGLQATWNFHESGHRKGVPDGVGGTLKRTANDLVLRGKDITSAKSFVESIQEQESLVMQYELAKEHIVKNTSTSISESKSFTWNIQIASDKNVNMWEIWYRDVSCTCVESCSEYGHNWKKSSISVDEDSLQIFPRDISQKELLELTPVRIGADGNCLPYTGSVFAFGDQKRAEEIRVRKIIEQTIFKDYYLDHDYLKRGTDNSYTNNALSKTYAMYSDEYIPNERLSLRKVEMVYQKEVMKITKNRSYMGIWQLFSLSSILCRPLFSVYPMLGNPNVHNDLHRVNPT
ncbi:unnamed protein product [Mytilus edulis]|uniref:Uncharacterized protein n=1 Tax=Mytilus edulis TaxID=6550 RepID=A0A8S3RJD0_MYTED|nr:unnamed protein product [Mytilus edulis]